MLSSYLVFVHLFEQFPRGKTGNKRMPTAEAKEEWPDQTTTTANTRDWPTHTHTQTLAISIFSCVWPTSPKTNHLGTYLLIKLFICLMLFIALDAHIKRAAQLQLHTRGEVTWCGGGGTWCYWNNALFAFWTNMQILTIIATIMVLWVWAGSFFCYHISLFQLTKQSILKWGGWVGPMKNE